MERKKTRLAEKIYLLRIELTKIEKSIRLKISSDYLLAILVGYFRPFAVRLWTKSNPKIRVCSQPIVCKFWYFYGFRIQNYDGP